MKATDVFRSLIDRAYLSVFRTRRVFWQGKPGEWIENLSPEEREALKDLKSEDVNKVTLEETKGAGVLSEMLSEPKG